VKGFEDEAKAHFKASAGPCMRRRIEELDTLITSLTARLGKDCD
jgi:hypothetical protein